MNVGQEAQMDQVGGSGVGVAAADEMPQHQPMQDVVGLGGIDEQFEMLRNSMRWRIFEYIGRKASKAEFQPRLPVLARRLEEILFTKFSNKNDYYNMMKGPVEPQLLFAIKTLSTQNQQNQQTSRQIASSSGYGTMIPTPGMTQGSSGNARLPNVTDSSALSSFSSGMDAQDANVGTLMQDQSCWPPLPVVRTEPCFLVSGISAISPAQPKVVQMNQVGSNCVGVAAADGMPQHQPMQDVVGLGGIDEQFEMLRNSMRERICEYIGRKSSLAEYRQRFPELARRLEAILYTKFSSKNEYYNMMKGLFEPQLQFAIKTLSAQNQQYQQTSRQIVPSSGHGAIIPTPGMTQGSSGNARLPIVTDSSALSSSSSGMDAQNANMGSSMQGKGDM